MPCIALPMIRRDQLCAIAPMSEQGDDSFGAVIRMADFDGDALADVMTGAPSYFEYDSGAAGEVSGRTYAVFGSTLRDGGTIQASHADGVFARGGSYDTGQFGFSVVGIKDVDGDGGDEIAASAASGSSCEAGGPVLLLPSP